MSPARVPMVPPALQGFDHLRLLGTGGYSDVFLYEQQMPRREVAIKVLLADSLGPGGRQQFHDEANSMAAVSTHPYIVTVFHADVSADGHPYLVMEYYPRQNYSVRARSEQLPVAEVLRVGIQVASAVETAHRSGLLHRDIKPANILTSAYNRPGLTDFGIATSVTGDHEAEGMSIPWSPPEVVDSSAPGDVTADVYSLAATVYTLLAGRSPFEVLGGSNKSLDLVARISAGNPPMTGRRDVPESLERVLRHSMDRRPSGRPPSALDFARLLQSVEQEQGWAPTAIEISEDPRDVRSREMTDPTGAPVGDDGTRLKSPTVIDAQRPLHADRPTGAAAASSAPSTAASSAAASDQTQARGSGPGPIISGIGSRPVGLSGHAGPRPVQPMPSSAVEAAAPDDQSGIVEAGSTSDVTSSGRRIDLRAIAVGAVVVVALLGGLAALRAVMGDGGGAEDAVNEVDPTPNTLPPAGLGRSAAPTAVVVTPVEGQVKVAWEYPADEIESTVFVVREMNSGAEVGQVTGQRTLSGPMPEGAICVTVQATADGRRASEPDDAKGCQ